MSKGYIPLQAPCPILVNGFIWLGSSISLSIDYIVHDKSIHAMCHTSLLLLTSIAFRLLDSVMSYDRSKLVNKVDEFDYSKFCEDRNLDFFGENRSYPSRELFAMPCCSFLKKYFRLLSYPMTTYLCKHPTRFSSIDRRGLDN
jgi:hypothetical protein